MANKFDSSKVTEHALNMFGQFMDKQIASHYMMKLVDEKLENMVPQIAEKAAAIVLQNFSVMVLNKATPQLQELQQDINSLLFGK